LNFYKFKIIYTSILVLNIGTSCQLSFLPSSKSFMESTHIQSWPYKATKPLCVVASMNGGNALASFTRMLKSWLQELGR